MRRVLGCGMLKLWHCPFEVASNPQLANLLNKQTLPVQCLEERASHRNACVAPQLEQDWSLSSSLLGLSLVSHVQSKLPATGPPYERLCSA